ncbi:MAG: formate dehydrogenase accessory sulfurtransferase FdhD [Candidatus Obscuribacterales bacterium]|nr:formate dehydrogenase accessory sulfurtransferase FdhD [Candidatus Obscuribacterales bacterium]
MSKTLNSRSIKKLDTLKVIGSVSHAQPDSLSVEEPLEIRIQQNSDGEIKVQPVAVTMRTPGDDKELAVGFLFSEGIIKDCNEIENVEIEKCNSVNIVLKNSVLLDPAIFARHSFVASSCGVCGKKSIAAVRVKRQFNCLPDSPLLSPDIIHKLPAALRLAQEHFEHTGGIHASALFDKLGNVQNIKEDVGRHNALDKILGSEFLKKSLPLTDKILMLSGRISFELVQKAAHAGIPIIVAVGAPSSLAVQLAEECDMTLLGFVKNERFNVYSGAQRIIGLLEKN